MPTFRHGRNTFFSIEDAADTVRNVSDGLRDISFPVSLDTPETTAFGSTVKTYVVGIKDARFSISGMFDATYDSYFQGIFGLEDARAFVYGPEGNAAGRISYSGAAFLTSYQVQGSVSDMVSVSCEFQVSGPVTRGVFA